jgi:hypothetical protein
MMLVGVLLALLQVACVDGAGTPERHEQLTVERVDVIQDTGLREAIINYYSAESRGDWQTTYRFRSTKFKELVPFDAYKRDMKKGMAGWKLQKIENIEHIIGKSEATVRIRFHEKFDSTVAKLFFGGNVPQGVSSRTENSLWKKVGERWLCVDAGQRGHLPLNDRMVYD